MKLRLDTVRIVDQLLMEVSEKFQSCPVGDELERLRKVADDALDRRNQLRRPQYIP